MSEDYENWMMELGEMTMDHMGTIAWEYEDRYQTEDQWRNGATPEEVFDRIYEDWLAEKS
jgi:hypothetical protein